MSATAVREPPFRAEHIGSLLRPDFLIKKRYEVAEGKADEASLRPIEDESIREIVQLQQACGFHGIGDGEHRRHQVRVLDIDIAIQTILTDLASFYSSGVSSLLNERCLPFLLMLRVVGTFFETLNGMSELQLTQRAGKAEYDTSIFRKYAPDVSSFLEDKVIPNQVTVATGKISHTGKSSYLPEFEYLKSILPEEEWKNVKITLPSPSWYHYRYGPKKAYTKDAYTNDDDYFEDVARAYRKELEILYGAGVRNVQCDDPNTACERHHNMSRKH